MKKCGKKYPSVGKIMIEKATLVIILFVIIIIQNRKKNIYNNIVCYNFSI